MKYEKKKEIHQQKDGGMKKGGPPIKVEGVEKERGPTRKVDRSEKRGPSPRKVEEMGKKEIHQEKWMDRKERLPPRGREV